MEYTEAYIEGIKDGREFLNTYKPNAADIVGIISNIKDTIKIVSLEEMKDILKGELAFWQAQQIINIK